MRRLAWRSELEISSDKDFNRIETVETFSGKSVTVNLKGGRYYYRARSINKDKIPGEWSEANSLTIERWQAIAEPTANIGHQSKIYRKKPPEIKIAFNQADGSQANEIQIARDRDFQNLQNALQSNDGEATVNLPKGTFYWRVRSKDKYGRYSKWSKPESVEIQKITDMPKSIFPSKDYLLVREYIDSQNVDFKWELPKDMQEATLYLSKHKNGKNPIASLDSSSAASTLEIEKDGKYYWYIEGHNRREKISLRSDINALVIRTNPLPPVERSKTPNEFYAGYGLSRMNYSFEDFDFRNKINSTYSNALFLSYTYWYTSQFGLELDLIGNLIGIQNSYKQEDGGTDDQSFYIQFLDFSTLARALFELSRSKGIQFEGLGGVATSTLAKIKNKDNKLETGTYQTVNAWVGAGILASITNTIFLNPRIEYGHPLYVDKADVNSGAIYKGTIRALQRLPHINANVSYGFFTEGRNLSITKNSLPEKISMSTYGLLLGMGKDL